MAFGRLLLVLSCGLVFGIPQLALAQANPWHVPDNNRPNRTWSNQTWPNQTWPNQTWPNQTWNGGNLPYQSQNQTGAPRPGNRQSGADQRRQRQAMPTHSAPAQSGSRWRGERMTTATGAWTPNNRSSSANGSYGYNGQRSEHGYNNGYGDNSYAGNSGNRMRTRAYPPNGYRPSNAGNFAAASRRPAAGPQQHMASRLGANSFPGQPPYGNDMAGPNSVQGRFVPNFAAGQFGPGRINHPPQQRGDYPPLNGDPASLNASGARPAAPAQRWAAQRYTGQQRWGQQQGWPQRGGPQQYATAPGWPAQRSAPVNPQWRAPSPEFAGPSTFGNAFGGPLGGAMGGYGYPFGIGSLDVYRGY